MDERSETASAAAAPLVRVPIDLVEFESRLLVLERRLREQEARDQLLLGLAGALRRLTEALGPLLETVRPAVPLPPEGKAHAGGSPPAPPQPVSPDRLALAQARMREAAVAPLLASESALAAGPIETAPRPAAAQPAPEPAPIETGPRPASPAFPPPGRRSWLLRSLRRMIAQDPRAAGRLLLALLPAQRLAHNEPVAQLPGEPGTVARVVVRGRLRRRLGWEMAQLDCELRTVSRLAKLVRLRTPPLHLHAAGVRLDPPSALALVACAIDPRWTLGHRFTLGHRESAAVTYLEICNDARPRVITGPPPVPCTTTVHCAGELLLPLLADASEVDVTVEGELWPLEVVQQWFVCATGA